MVIRLFAAALSLASVACFAQTAQPAAQTEKGPAQSPGRLALIQSLDDLAAKDTASRREKIAAIHTRAQAETRQRQVRATMLRLIGPLPEKKPLKPQVVGETALAGFRIEKILFDSQPGFHVTALLYLPDNPEKKPLPAIVMAPGHSPAGKAGDFAFAAAFARNGIAVLSYDPIGQGERIQYPDPADANKSLATRPTGEHAEASLQPILIGESLAKYMLWDGMRAVDYLQSRPEIDPERIGAFGCSGGGAMTALLGALDARIAATGVACYTTSFDTLLPAIGPQDGEQSTPGWIAAGLDFPDWVEIAAPRPYAIIATESDMFPFAGAQSTEAEARSFYKLFDADKDLAFIHGPGGHGNLRPIQPAILAFFQNHLSPGAPSLTALSSRVGSTDPPPAKPESPPAGALQVSPTGQVSTSYPGAETVFSLNLKHAATLPKPKLPLAPAQLRATVRQTLGPAIQRVLPAYTEEAEGVAFGYHNAQYTVHSFQQEQGVVIPYDLAVPLHSTPTENDSQSATILLMDELPYATTAFDPRLVGSRMDQLVNERRVVLALTPRPAPVGSEDMKSPILGPFYLLGLRAELTGHTLLGMRVDDVLHAVDELERQLAIKDIRAEADGHLALVLLHAAVLDARITHITLTHLPPSYRERLAEPLPRDLPTDILPGVLLHYDIPGLIRALGPRVTVVSTPQ